MRAVCILAMIVAVCAGAHTAPAAEAGCGQMLVDGFVPPATAATILPRQPVQPFYQWENNDGYCGEVSMLQAGLSNGQFMSQFNARLICGTGLSQAGVPGACAAHGSPNYNAQLLLEAPGTGVTGPGTYADAPLCLANSRLSATTFPYTAQSTGLAGYRHYMSWIKQQVIGGAQVTIGVLENGGTDAQYDHIVTVLKIGTNHAPTDPTYYPDDVVYFDDHGVYTLRGQHFTNNPAIPPGAGSDDTGCTPYVFGYSFAMLPRSRAAANGRNAPAYSVVLPNDVMILTGAGGSGYNQVPIIGPHNYAFAVSGPLDADAETLPVALSIVGPTYSNGVENPRDPVAGYCYENPMIGRSTLGRSCTDKPPAHWMTNLTLQATVSGLRPGVSYNLYEYDFAAVSGTGTAAALAVPVAAFNANAALATRVTTFTASAATYTHSVTTTSNMIVVFRCVPAGAP